MKGGNASILIENKGESHAPCTRPVCDVSRVRKSLSLVQEWRLLGVSTFSVPVSLPITRCIKTKQCVWFGFILMQSEVEVIGTCLRIFLLFICLFCLFCLRDALRSRTLGMKRLSGAQLTQHAGTPEIVLSCWSDETLEYAELEIPGERNSSSFRK